MDLQILPILIFMALCLYGTALILNDREKWMKLIITNKSKPGAVVHITNDEQRIEAIKQRAKSKGDKVEEIK